MDYLLDLLFPKSCNICGKKGEYLCFQCKKLFKRTLPECYICRRVSSNYKTHDFCRTGGSLDTVLVSWEYNSLSSTLLKNYKYKNVFDISTELSKFFLESLKSFNLNKILERTLVVNIPISRNRLNDRGFNQTYDIANSLAKKLNVQFSNTVLAKRNTYEHQSLKNKDDRRNLEEIFFVQEDIDIKEFKSITLVDDVITTGSTLEMAARALRKRYGNNLKIYAVCMLRGRAYYSNISTPSISTSTISTVSSFSSSS